MKLFRLYYTIDPLRGVFTIISWFTLALISIYSFTRGELAIGVFLITTILGSIQKEHEYIVRSANVSPTWMWKSVMEYLVGSTEEGKDIHKIIGEANMEEFINYTSEKQKARVIGRE